MQGARPRRNVVALAGCACLLRRHGQLAQRHAELRRQRPRQLCAGRLPQRRYGGQRLGPGRFALGDIRRRQLDVGDVGGGKPLAQRQRGFGAEQHGAGEVAQPGLQHRAHLGLALRLFEADVGMVQEHHPPEQQAVAQGGGERRFEVGRCAPEPAAV
jgi:hypothetical protein